MSRTFFVLLMVLLLYLLTVTVSAQSALEDAAFFLAFHACNPQTTDCLKPQKHQVYVALSSDGAAWELLPDWQPFPGSVPDVIRRENTLSVYTARQELVTYDLTTHAQTAPVRVCRTGPILELCPHYAAGCHCHPAGSA